MNRGPKVHVKFKDPTNPGFWNPPCLGPQNQHVGSLRLCGLWGGPLRKNPKMGPAHKAQITRGVFQDMK